MNFQGTYTAIVTPFTNGHVDYGVLKDLVEAQIAGGVTGIVPVGTTGESPTLDMDEHIRVIETVIAVVAGRCQVVAGTGGNATSEALELTREAKAMGADACLQVTPYYNRPSQAGLIRHFQVLADVGLPVMLYNIPSRTGRELTVDTVVELAKHPNIQAIKEAGGACDRVSLYRQRCDITVLCGDDFLTLPMMVLGATGVVSVASNIAPAEVVTLTRLARDGDWAAARDQHYRLYDLFSACFIDPNPTPSKAMLHMLGRIPSPDVRLPLAPLEPSSRPVLERTLRALGLDPA